MSIITKVNSIHASRGMNSVRLFATGQCFSFVFFYQ